MLSKLLPEECTFTPHVNSRAVEGREGECHERLHQQALALQQKKDALAGSPGAGHSFSPTITKKAQKLTEESEKQRLEKGLSVGEALYEKVRERRARPGRGCLPPCPSHPSQPRTAPSAPRRESGH